MTQRVTGWLFTDATGWVKCPQCGQLPGAACKTPAGRMTGSTHVDRVVEYTLRYPGREELYKNRSSIEWMQAVKKFNAELEAQYYARLEADNVIDGAA